MNARITVKRALYVALAGCIVTTMSCSDSSGGKHLVVQSNVEMSETNINSQIPGKIAAVSVKEGDMVSKGQIVITVDSDTLNAQLSQAKARITAARAQKESAIAARELAQNTFKRISQMWTKGAITRAEFDEATMKVKQADAGFDAIDAQLAVAEGSLAEINSYIDKATMAAPVSGVVTQINVEAGELVTTGMPLIVITANDTPWIQCSIRETNLSKVHLGQTVEVHFPAYADQKFQGTVTRINKDADFAVKRATNDNGTFDVLSYGVKVEISAIEEPLYNGMTAIVTFGE